MSLLSGVRSSLLSGVSSSFRTSVLAHPHQASSQLVPTTVFQSVIAQRANSATPPKEPMRVVLINPNTRGDYRKGKIHTSNYGLGMLSGYLQHHNQAQVKIVDGRFQMLSPEAAYAQFKDFKPNLVGFSLLVDLCVPWSNRVIDLVKQDSPSTHIALGSYFPSLLPQDAYRLVPQADSIIAGEGEPALSELVDKIQRNVPWQDTKGLILKKETEKGVSIVKTEHRDLIENTDLLPYPDRYMARGDGSEMEAMVEGTRGCLFACSFCAVNSFDGLSHGSTIRIRSAASLADEIAALYQKYPRLQGIRFVDSDFVLPGTEERAKAFAELLLERQLNARFMFDIRAPSVVKYQDILASLHQAGLQRVYMGLESGSAEILKKMRKASTPEKNAEAASILREMGVDYSYGFMMITPWTLDSHIGENRRMLSEVGRIEFRSLFHEMTLIPGTTSYRDAQKLGELTWRGSLSYYTYKTLSPRVEKYREISSHFRDQCQPLFEAAGYIYESLRQLHRIGEHEKMERLQWESDRLFLDIFDTCWDFSSRLDTSPQEIGEFVSECSQKFSSRFSTLLSAIDPSINLTNCNIRVPNHAPRYQI